MIKYDPETYHNQSRANMARKVDKGTPSEIIQIIDQKILEEQWSPEQISNWIKIHKKVTVSHVWIYKYVAQDKEEGGELHNHMCRGSYNKSLKEYKGKIPNRVSIEKRPEIVKKRERLGNYEIDLIVGPKNKGAILTVIDRKSREFSLSKLKSKGTSEVAIAVIKSIKTNPTQ